MSKNDWGDIVGAIFILAIVAVLVRPSSIAPAFITASGDGLAAIIGFAVSA